MRTNYVRFIDIGLPITIEVNVKFGYYERTVMLGEPEDEIIIDYEAALGAACEYEGMGYLTLFDEYGDRIALSENEAKHFVNIMLGK